ncbi:MAG TPA: iron-containing alcohol dehydrogenase [Gaiellales bacterium]|nr:iron-containing alcohol dehydrogenase [Gaiellales bacterium]
MIDPFGFHLPVRIQFGEGAAGALPDVLSELAAHRPVAIADEAVAGVTAGMETLVKPPGEPTVAMVEELARRLDELHPDAVVAVGGGSALDTAKGARAAHGQAVAAADIYAGRLPIAPPRIPLVAVPTTSGTGSEVSGGSVMTDEATGRKTGIASPLMRAQHALVDPLLTLALPRDATMQTGADALAQAIGGVTVRNGNPGSVALGLEACRHVAAGYAAAVRDGSDRAARAEMSLGSLIAGLSMNLSDCGADHALGHALGAGLHLPHGLAVGLVLAETLDVSRPACAARLERVADALGEPDDGSGDGSRAVRAVRRLLRDAAFPTLADAGATAAAVDDLVPAAAEDYCLTVDAHDWSEADVRAAFQAALALDAR